MRRSANPGRSTPAQKMVRLESALAGFHPRAIAIDIAFLNSEDEATDVELARASRRRQPSSRRSGCSTRPIVRAQRPSRATWRWRRNRPPFFADRGDPRYAQVGLANVSINSAGATLYSDDLSDAGRLFRLSRLPRRPRRSRPSRSSVLIGSRWRGAREKWTSAITCRCVSTGRREASGDQRSPGPARRPRSGGFAR